jgi:ATP-binding cassette subfamily E protein 1
MFDEPSNYLDIYQRLKVARVIRNMSNDKTYVIVVEHDLSILVCCLYGQAEAYGIVTFPSSVRDGSTHLLMV